MTRWKWWNKMGMYTQYRGYLNITSTVDSFDVLKTEFEKLQNIFSKREDLRNPDVSNQCLIFEGGNGTSWIFFGIECKDRDDSVKEWIKTILQKFYAEGTIEVQYEGNFEMEIVTVSENNKGEPNKINTKTESTDLGGPVFLVSKHI